MHHITKNQIKHASGLQQKKFREVHGQFLVEGVKMVQELLNADWNIAMICGTASYYDKYGAPEKVECLLAADKEMDRMSALKNHQQVLAVVQQKDAPTMQSALAGLVLALDDVSDPGNMGTILRTAEWFGVQEVWLSEGSVDIYNPKVVQASMGSLFRMGVKRGQLAGMLRDLPDEYPKFGAVLDGEDCRTIDFPNPMILVMGSEAHGISAEVQAVLSHRITIPSYGNAESLNVAMASGILLFACTR